MGVNIFHLQRRQARLSVGGIAQDVGSLRRFWKVTELDSERAAELAAAEAVARASKSPSAAMLADVSELPLGSEDGPMTKAHLVIGWDEGRTSVTDMRWEFLPTLGYGVKDPAGNGFVLHEDREGVLHPVSRERAAELGLTDPGGHLIRRGQPIITACHTVRPYITGYAEAECTLDTGRTEKLLIRLADRDCPNPSWFVGRTPKQVEKYPPSLPE